MTKCARLSCTECLTDMSADTIAGECKMVSMEGSFANSFTVMNHHDDSSLGHLVMLLTPKWLMMGTKW